MSIENSLLSDGGKIEGPANISLELTGLSWSFAGLEQVAAKVGRRGHKAWAALQLSSDRWAAMLH